MRAFRWNFNKESFARKCACPNEFLKVYEYLVDNGKLTIDPRNIPEYFANFKRECYNNEWVCLNTDLLYEFAEWLSKRSTDMSNTIKEGKILQTLNCNNSQSEFNKGYNKGYENGLRDSVKHTDVIEERDDGYDYPTTKWICSNCGAEVYPDDCNYCDMCGYKIDGKKIPIPESDCKLCRWTNTGLKENCHWSIDGSCKFDSEPHWIFKGSYAVCSNCGAISGTQYDGVEPVPRISKYCPDCGSKMRVVK